MGVRGKGVECGLRFVAEPEVERCGYCHSGILIGEPGDISCSFCGAQRPVQGLEATGGQ